MLTPTYFSANSHPTTMPDISENSIKLDIGKCGNDQKNRASDVTAQKVRLIEEVSKTYPTKLVSSSKPVTLHSLYSYTIHPIDTGLNIDCDDLQSVVGENMDSEHDISELSGCHGNRLQDNKTESSDSAENIPEKKESEDAKVNTGQEENGEDHCRNRGEVENEDESVEVKDTQVLDKEDSPETEDVSKRSLDLRCQEDRDADAVCSQNEEPLCNTEKCWKDDVPEASVSGKASPVDLCLSKPEIINVNFRQRGNLPVQRVHPHVHKPPSCSYVSGLTTLIVDTSSAVYTSNTGEATQVSVNSNNSSLPLPASFDDLSRSQTRDTTEVSFEAADLLQASDRRETNTTLSHAGTAKHEKIHHSPQVTMTPAISSCCETGKSQGESDTPGNGLAIHSNDATFTSNVNAPSVTQTYSSQTSHGSVQLILLPSQTLVNNTTQGIAIAGNSGMIIPIQPMVQTQTQPVLTQKPAVKLERTVCRSQRAIMPKTECKKIQSAFENHRHLEPSYTQPSMQQSDQQPPVTTSQRSAQMITKDTASHGQHLPPPPLLLHSPTITAQDLSMDKNKLAQQNTAVGGSHYQMIPPIPRFNKDNLSKSSFRCLSQTISTDMISDDKGNKISNNNHDINSSHNNTDQEPDVDDLDISEEIKKEMEALDAEIKRKEREQEEMKRKKLELLQKVKQSQTLKPIHHLTINDNDSQMKPITDTTFQYKETSLDTEQKDIDTNRAAFDIDSLSEKGFKNVVTSTGNKDSHEHASYFNDEITIDSDCSDRDSPKLVVDEDKCDSDTEIIDDISYFNSDPSLDQDDQEMDRNENNCDQVIDFSLKEKLVAPSIESDINITVVNKDENLENFVEETSQTKPNKEKDNDNLLIDFSISKDNERFTNDNSFVECEKVLSAYEMDSGLEPLCTQPTKQMMDTQSKDIEFLDLSMKCGNTIDSEQSVECYEKLADDDNDTCIKTEIDYECSTSADNAQNEIETVDEATFVSSLDLSKKKTNDSSVNIALPSAQIKSEPSVFSEPVTECKVTTQKDLTPVKLSVEIPTKENKPVGFSNLSVRDITSPIITTDLASDALSALKSSNLGSSNPVKQIEKIQEKVDGCNKVPEVNNEESATTKDVILNIKEEKEAINVLKLINYRTSKVHMNDRNHSLPKDSDTTHDIDNKTMNDNNDFKELESNSAELRTDIIIDHEKSGRKSDSISKIENKSTKESSNKESNIKPVNTKRSIRYIELLPAHYKPRTHIQKTDKPLPAHQNKIESKEVLKKIDKIQMKHLHKHDVNSSPYMCRTEPYSSSPDDWKKHHNKKDKKDVAVSAHYQEPFRIPGYLIVQSRKTGRKRKIMEDVSGSGEMSDSTTPTIHATNLTTKQPETNLIIFPAKARQARQICISQSSPLSAHIDPNQFADGGDVLVTKVSRPPIASDRMPLENKNNRHDNETVIDLTSHSPGTHSRRRPITDILTDTEITIQQELTAALAKRQKGDTELGELFTPLCHTVNDGKVAQSNHTVKSHKIQGRPSSIPWEQAPGKQHSRVIHQDELRIHHPQSQMRQHGDRHITNRDVPFIYQQHASHIPQDRIPLNYSQDRMQTLDPKLGTRRPQYSQSISSNMQVRPQHAAVAHTDVTYMNKAGTRPMPLQPLRQDEHYINQSIDLRRPSPSGINHPALEPSRMVYPPAGLAYHRDKRRVQPQIGGHSHMMHGLDPREGPHSVNFQRQRNASIPEEDMHGIQISPIQSFEGQQQPLIQLSSPEVGYHPGHIIVSPPASSHNTGLLQRAMGHMPSTGSQPVPESSSPGSKLHRQVGHSSVYAGSPHCSTQSQQPMGYPSSVAGHLHRASALSPDLQLVQLLQQKQPHLHASDLGQLTVEEKMKQVRAQFLRAQMERKQRKLQKQQQQNLELSVDSLATSQLTTSNKPQTLASPSQQMTAPHLMNSPSKQVDVSPQLMTSPKIQMAAPAQQMASSIHQMASPTQHMAAFQRQSSLSLLPVQNQNYQNKSDPVLVQQQGNIRSSQNFPSSLPVAHGQGALDSNHTDCQGIQAQRQTPTHVDHPSEINQTQGEVINRPLNMSVTKSIPQTHSHQLHKQHVSQKRVSDSHVANVEQNQPSEHLQSYQEVRPDVEKHHEQVIEIKDEPLSPAPRQQTGQQQQLLLQPHKHQLQFQNQHFQNQFPQEQRSQVHISNQQRQEPYDLQQQQQRKQQYPRNQLQHQNQPQQQIVPENLRHQQGQPHNQLQRHPHHQPQAQPHQYLQQHSLRHHQQQPLIQPQRHLYQQQYHLHHPQQQRQLHQQSQRQQQQQPHQQNLQQNPRHHQRQHQHVIEQTHHQHHIQPVPQQLQQPAQARVMPQNRDQLNGVPFLQQVKGACVMCGNFSMFLCSKCKKFWYCSPECQLKHWRTRHAAECRP